MYACQDMCKMCCYCQLTNHVSIEVETSEVGIGQKLIPAVQQSIFYELHLSRLVKRLDETMSGTMK